MDAELFQAKRRRGREREDRGAIHGERLAAALGVVMMIVGIVASSIVAMQDSGWGQYFVRWRLFSGLPLTFGLLCCCATWFRERLWLVLFLLGFLWLAAGVLAGLGQY